MSGADRGSRGQFQPGQTGNPRGRPRKHRDVNQTVRDAFAETVTVTENGRKRKMAKLQAAASQLANKAAAGDPRAGKIALDLALKMGDRDTSQDAPALLSDTDVEIFNRVLLRLREIVREDLGND